MSDATKEPAMQGGQKLDISVKDICFPTTAEMRKTLNSAVLGEYQRTMAKIEDRGSVLDAVKQKAAEVKPPMPGNTKAADKGAR